MFAKGSAIGQDVVNKVKAFDEKHQLIASASEKAISFYRKVGLTEKLTVGIFVVNEKVKSVDIKQWQQYFQQRKLNDTWLAVQTSRYVTAWLNGAFGKGAKAGQVAGQIAVGLPILNWVTPVEIEREY
ncbi:hypothetical protein ACFXTO_035001 [Malus domestica]|nr:binding partner of ACD11 1-like [Malus domestica]